MSETEISPPKFYNKIFEWFCNQDLYFELQGDLLEEFEVNYHQKGIKTANRIYKKEVLKMLRPSVVKKVKTQGQLNNTAMFRNYTLVAFRNLSRNKLFSAINIIGLAISMAVGLLAITFVSEINSYDKFHENRDHIYRIVNTRTNLGQSPQEYATTSLLTGVWLKENSTVFEKVVPVLNGFNGNIKYGENRFSVRGQLVGEDFLDLFTFPLLYGNSQTALKEPNSVVITENFALRVFSKKDVVGEIIQRGRDQFTITGVMQQPPSVSHIKFDAIASLKTYEAKPSRARFFNDWGTMWSSYVYVQLGANSTIEHGQEILDLLAKQENAKQKAYEIKPGLEALTDIFPGSGKYNQMGTVMPKENVNQIVILALIVLFSACFNYSNLSIAKSLKRAKEIGVRKVAGARKNQLFIQFVSEAVIVSVLSLVIAFFLFQLIKPEFLALNSYTSRTTTLDLLPRTYFYFLGFAILIGFLAGALPAILMTRFKTINILKGVTQIGSNHKLNLRKIMIGIQFTLSMGFVIIVTLTQKQYKHALNFDLGYETEKIINIYWEERDITLIKTAFEKIPGIEGVSASNFQHSTGTLNSDIAKNLEGTDSATVYNNYVDTEYLNNMGHRLLAGENFKAEGPTDQMVINETLLSRFKLGNPNEAIGKQLNFYDKNRTIVGVVKDFHYGTIYNQIRPFAFLWDSERYLYHVNVKVTSNDMPGTLAQVENAWNEIYPEYKLNSSFYSEDIKRTYADLSSSAKTFGMLAMVAICISMLGLLGMAVFTTEARIKELTIRKVLGASLSSLLSLLSKSFLTIFVIAACIAIPSTYYMFKNLILKNIEYTIDIGFWELASGSILIIIIALLTITSQTLKAARSNPAKNLRNA